MTNEEQKPEYEDSADVSQQESESSATAAQEQPGVEASSADSIAQERDEYKEKYMRALADLENYRRRAAKERQELVRYAAERPLGELFPIFDNLQRAVDHASANPDTIVQGVSMIMNMADQAFERLGVSKVGKPGEKFDPNLHEAFSQLASDDVPAGHIVQVFEQGYRLHEKLLRAAKVVVSTGNGEATMPNQEQEQGEAPPASEKQDQADDASYGDDDLLAKAAADLEDWNPAEEEDTPGVGEVEIDIGDEDL